MQPTCVQTGEPWFSSELGEVLGGLKYPLYFADFESVNPGDPRFAGCALRSTALSVERACAAGAGRRARASEFLATDGSDPRREFISSLCAALGESGSIVVYSSFESQRLSELASWFPEFADRITALQARLFDLLPIVREHTYHPAYAGSYSDQIGACPRSCRR